ncbi:MULTISPECIES: Crp/Fnr family transcriptional regulator [Clostridiaceae]|uniref:Crp/Fnr family transcriptional regulator n=1 Tax=Clostridiaceae TaxID=31979 RepID=UPI0005512031|nr:MULTISPECIES: Crp/Fnr family transcriptional regulator [Clostridiaceae]
MIKFEHIIKLLITTQLFNGLTYEELSEIFKKYPANVTAYSSNAVVYFQGECCTGVDIVLNGQIQIQKIDTNGDMSVICNFTVGDSVGENLLFSRNNTYPLTIITKYDTEILHLSKQLILYLCHNDRFLQNFLESLSDKTLILSGKIKTLSTKSIRRCIIEFLLYEYRIQKSTTIFLNLSKKELSEKFGIQRPSLSRELNKMRSKGLIEYNAKSITITDVEELKRIYSES